MPPHPPTPRRRGQDVEQVSRQRQAGGRKRVRKGLPCLTAHRCLGWAEGFEPSATGTTIRRSTKLSYAHRERTSSSYQLTARDRKRDHSTNLYSPTFFHSSSTRFFTSASIWITPGHARVKPSAAHLRVASI